MNDLLFYYTELVWKMKLHFAFPDPSAGYEISIGYIKFYNCYPLANEYSVEIIDNPCTGGLSIAAEINGGPRPTEYTFTMGDSNNCDYIFTSLSNGECTWELEIASINSETDSALWPAIYTLTQPTFTP